MGKKRWWLIGTAIVLAIITIRFILWNKQDKPDLDLPTEEIEMVGAQPKRKKETGTTAQAEVSFVSAEKKKYMQKDIIVITYQYTNHEEEPRSFAFAIVGEAYQNGEKLEPFYKEENLIYDYASSLNGVSPGETAVVQEAFYLEDGVTDVQIECSAYRKPKESMLQKKFPIVK